MKSSLAVRERAMFSRDQIPGALERLRATCEESFLLSTCNRSEVYALTGHAQSGAEKLRQFICSERDISEDVFLENSYSFAHEDAVRHFFRVASGLDSMALGESEILGQIRRALDDARSAGALGHLLGRLGAAGLRAGRDVRSATRLGRSRISLVSLAFDEIALRGISLRSARITILGGGETAESVIRFLQSNGATNIVVTSRTGQRTEQVASLYGISSHSWANRTELISRSDVVFACTSSTTPVITPDQILGRSSQPVVFIDLGAPRDIDPVVRDFPGVTVIDLQELDAIAAENRLRRRGEVSEAEGVVDSSVERFMEWWRSRQVAPTIIGMRTLAESIRDDELARAMSKLGTLDATQAQVIRAMAHRIVGKLLHRPLTMLRHDAENGNMAQVLRYLFQLDGAPVPGEGPEGIPCARSAEASPVSSDEKQDSTVA